MSKRIMCYVSILVVIFAVTPFALGQNQKVFGPRDLEISNWHLHLSRHAFSVDNPITGMLVVEKRTPEKEIMGGFVIFNHKLIPLRHFLHSDDLITYKDIVLKSNNNLFFFLRGTPKAIVNFEIRTAENSIEPPSVAFQANPMSVTLGEATTLSWQASDADIVFIDHNIGRVTANGFETVTPLETTLYLLTATGPGGTTTESVMVTVREIPRMVVVPDVVGYAQAEAEAAILAAELTLGNSASENSDTVPEGYVISQHPTAGNLAEVGSEVDLIASLGPISTAPSLNIFASPETIQIGESATLHWDSANTDNVFIEPSVGTVSVNGSITVSPVHTTTYTITATGPTGSTSAQAVIMVIGNPEPQPEGHFGAQYEDLIPQDATVESYDPKRFSLVTGLVQDQESNPIANVHVTIFEHQQYGTAITDDGGQYTIPVEGGKNITVVCQKKGLLTVHRKVYVPWNDIATSETIRMVTQDDLSTTVILDGNPDTIITHQSTEVSDTFGSRTCAMVFTGDNHAYLVDEKGNDVHELTTITVRSTEYSRADSMPAKLPPNSAYTYCVELSVDGVQRVRFQKPVMLWIDNFLGFPVGMAVPVGYYDRLSGSWIPSDNGAVVRLLDTDTDGIVDALDTDGDDRPDDLNGDGFFTDEVMGLHDPVSYPPGATCWRVAVKHFSPWDCNWPYGPPSDAIPPNPKGAPSADQQIENDCRISGKCFVEARSRVFHEDITIPGTDITLHYASNRVEGFHHQITVPVSGDSVPESLKRIAVKAQIAGRIFKQSLDPLSNQKATFTWDGLDHMGRTVSGPTTAHIDIGFVYDAAYYRPNDFGQAFGQAGIELTAIRARQEIVSWRRSEIVVDVMRARDVIAEGWTVSHHHHLNPERLSTLYKGDGAITKNDGLIIDTLVGNGVSGYFGDGGLGIEAGLNFPRGVAADADGNLYIADYANHLIRKVDTRGFITTVVGNGTGGYSGDGGSAFQAQIQAPEDVVEDDWNNLFVVDFGNHCIRKINAAGIITTIAGNGSGGYSGDGGPARLARLENPYDAAVDIAGNLYIADYSNQRIRKVNTNGIITTVAGNGIAGFSGDGGPAVDAQLWAPIAVAVDASGNLYIGEYLNSRIRQVDTSGTIRTLAGNGTWGYSGDGGLAIEAQLNRPMGITVDASNNLYIADRWNNCVRKVHTNGVVTTVAGNGAAGFDGDGGPAAAAQFFNPSDVVTDAVGNLYIGDQDNHRIRKVAFPANLAGAMTAGDIPFSEENGLGHVISTAGQHKTTIDLNAGVPLCTFSYDKNNRLIAIADRFDAQTTIQRDASGSATAIISPDDITTTLTVDSHNHLIHVTYPNGANYGFEYTPNGLMTAKVDPEGNRSEHLFGTTGRLTDTIDEEGGHWRYSSNVKENGNVVTEVLSGENNLMSYLDHRGATGAVTSTITDATGATTYFFQAEDELTVDKVLPCGMELIFGYDVDNEYKFKYLTKIQEMTPSGVTRTTIRQKTYDDLDLDTVPDSITETITVNGKSLTLLNNVLQSQKMVTSPEGRTVSSLYDPTTLLTSKLTIPGLYETYYAYDERGRLTSVVNNTRETVFAYDTQGFLGSFTDSENHTTLFTFDSVGRIVEVDRPDGSSLGFNYDRNGNMTIITNPSNVDHIFDYNAVNHNSSYQTPLSGSYSYLYDRDRRLVKTIFPSGNQINKIYADGRLTQIQTSEGSIDFMYLCNNNIDSITKGTEVITYGYDGKLVTSENFNGVLNQTLSFDYNNDFNLTSFTYAGGTESYTYDDDGLLIGIGDYIVGRNTGNGLPETVIGDPLSLIRTFNGYGELKAQHVTVNGNNLIDWDLTRDNAGRITNKIETINGVTTNYMYGYDPVGKLLSVTKNGILLEEYQYNPNGTRRREINTPRGIAERTFGYSEEDHLLVAGPTAYKYDVDGFLTSKTSGTDVTTYNYSSRGELLGVTLPDGTAIDYVYDPLGRRIAKVVDGVITEKYLWQGLTRLLAIYDSNDKVVMRFRYADDRMPITMIQGGANFYLAYDQIGSLRVVADDTGTIIKRIDYDAFGNVLTDTNPSFLLPLGFAGGLYDRHTDLVRFGYRDYDPDIGRWTAKDPILFTGGNTDLYGYCLNDPVNWVDFEGLWLIDIGVSGSVKGSLGPGGTTGLQISSSGLYWYYGIGLGVGGGLSATFNPFGNPSEGVGVTGTVRGGTGIVGTQAGGNLGPRGLSWTWGAGFGIGFGGSITAEQTIHLIDWSSVYGKVSNFFYNAKSIEEGLCK